MESSNHSRHINLLGMVDGKSNSIYNVEVRYCKSMEGVMGELMGDFPEEHDRIKWNPMKDSSESFKERFGDKFRYRLTIQPPYPIGLVDDELFQDTPDFNPIFEQPSDYDYELFYKAVERNLKKLDDSPYLVYSTLLISKDTRDTDITNNVLDLVLKKTNINGYLVKKRTFANVWLGVENDAETYYFEYLGSRFSLKLHNVILSCMGCWINPNCRVKNSYLEADKKIILISDQYGSPLSGLLDFDTAKQITVLFFKNYIYGVGLDRDELIFIIQNLFEYKNFGNYFSSSDQFNQYINNLVKIINQYSRLNIEV